jgi:hypothetical protein
MTNNLNSTEVEWPEFGASFNGSWEIPAGSPYVNIDELVGLSNGTLVPRDGDYGSAALVASRCTVRAQTHSAQTGSNVAEPTTTPYSLSGMFHWFRQLLGTQYRRSLPCGHVLFS